ncbi:MAG: hypothetical protein CMC73_02835 [Flavobacteriaceae bacterium]|nr:hypothetical protein [Flavobacteriaceae bacterium]|tara:strand:- start:669 stop:1274 length:606 start_codon:yes stop_codon:yes gene_type:complete
MTDNINEQNGVLLQGHIKISDPESGKVIVDKRNAIHYENMSIALAESITNAGEGFVYEMSFGNGGTSVDPTGIITYLTPNSTGTNASLYNQTYTKVVDDRSVNNTDPARNKLETRHVSGTNYTDVIVSCLLDYGEPNGQDAFDTANDLTNNYIFDELGLRSYDTSGSGRLLTHVIFHPVQKSLNRLIQIDYTVRIQSLSGV